MKNKGIELRVSQTAKEELINKGYNPKMGARPMARIIENEIIEPLSDEILFGKLKNGGKVEVDFVRGKFKFKF